MIAAIRNAFTRPVDAESLSYRIPVVVVTVYFLTIITSYVTDTPVHGYEGHLYLLYILAILLLVVRTFFRQCHRLRLVIECYALWHASFPPIHALTYLTQMAGWQLQDQAFLAFDQAVFGFDYVATLKWLDQFPTVHDVLLFAYRSFFTQIPLTMFAFVVLGRVKDAEKYVLAFLLSLLATTLVSAYVPAYGAILLVKDLAFDNFHFTGASPVDHITALRNGTMTSVDLNNCGGVISFPSFHAATALLVTYSWRKVKAVFYPLLVLNTLMSIAAVTEGAHYICDVLAGFGITALCIYAVNVMFDSRKNYAITVIESEQYGAP